MLIKHKSVPEVPLLQKTLDPKGLTVSTVENVLQLSTKCLLSLSLSFSPKKKKRLNSFLVSHQKSK